MTQLDYASSAARNPKWIVIVGWVLTVLPAALLVGLGTAMLINPAPMEKQMPEMGFPAEYARPIVATEVVCGLLYLIPQTAVLGAILVTGYLGGAVVTHLRIGETGKMFMPFLFGVVAWLGLFLRDARLRSLLPFRSTK